MTPESPSVHRAGCPEPALLAAHAERRLSGDEVLRLDEHIAGCQACYEVFAEAIRFGLDEAQAQGALPAGARSAAAPSAWTRRPSIKTAAFLAAAAVVLLALGLWFPSARLGRGAGPLVAELAQAMGERRFVEPRLTGGFRHARVVTLRSGDSPQGLDAQSPAVLAAIARIRDRAEGDTSPEALGALGITYLVSGDAAAAVKALESASSQAPEDARLLSDLAAAYLVRAAQADEPADIPMALEAAERAIALEGAPVEAWFNRALALERLHLVGAARKAWQDYLDRDGSSPWADEARQRLEALPEERKSSAEEDAGRVRAALRQGPLALERLAARAPNLLREHLEDELLPAWAEAHLTGHPHAHAHRDRARIVGEALSRATRDPIALETARALAAPPDTVAARDPLRSQALGFRSFREARRLYDRQQPSCAGFREALRNLHEGGSPLAAWAQLQVVSACFFPSEPQAALGALAELEAHAARAHYLQLLGRVHWLQGLAHVYQARLTNALERYRAARDAFSKTGDVESEAVVLALLAENLQGLGESRGAWRHRQEAFALLDHVRDPRRRQGLFGEAVIACVDQQMPRAALHFGEARVDVAMAWARPVVVADALLGRADIHHSLGAGDRAASDLRDALTWITHVGEKSWAERLQAEADAVEGKVLTEREPDQAVGALERSIAYFEAPDPARIPMLRLHLARAQAARGFDDAAEAELLAGIQALEGQRTALGDAHLQVSFFDRAQPLFDDMVRLQVTRRRDPERGLAFVERGRARQLVDALASGAGPLDPEALRRELPEGVALVYHLPLADRLFAWALSRDGSQFVERPLPAGELSRLVAAYRAALEGRAAEGVVRGAAARLHDELVRPFIPFVAARRALVFIPSGVLQSLPFAGLWDRLGSRYLVEDYVLSVVPSGTVFARASADAVVPRGRATRALIVGNPSLDRRVSMGLPPLRGAEAEAGEIGRLYAQAALLTGSAATKAAFRAGLRGSQVVHYAGHAVAGEGNPGTARLLLAADPATGDPGFVYLNELTGWRLPDTRVVVLAACRTAAGPESRFEGRLSLARPFLAAGVRDVVATLWDVDDSDSRRFFVTFHRALLERGHACPAVRSAQRALLASGEPALAHPASWAAFVCMGGLDPHSLSKGDAS